MLSARKTIHLDANLGNDRRSCRPIHARNPLEESKLLLKRGEELLCLSIQFFNRVFEGIDMPQDRSDEYPMMRFHTPFQRLLQDGELLAQLALGEIG